MINYILCKQIDAAGKIEEYVLQYNTEEMEEVFTADERHQLKVLGKALRQSFNRGTTIYIDMLKVAREA